MPRDPSTLTGTRWDLLVVGGGIHGLFSAYDAAARGLSVALVDCGDFGGGLSFNHQRTIHGGLRALETAQLGKVREQIAERRTWARIAPRLVRPLPFHTPTHGVGTRSRWALGLGLAAYDWLGRDRNDGLPPSLHLPAGRVTSDTAIWYDYQATHPDRLNWLVALASKGAGARLFNYVDAVAPLSVNGRIAGAHVRDRVTGRGYDVEAAATLLAVGGNVAPVMRAFGVTGHPPLVRAMNLLLERPSAAFAVAARASSGRMLTAVPWGGRTLVGTFQSNAPVEAPDAVPTASLLGEMLAEVASAFPALQADRSAVRLVHRGLTPAIVRNGRANLLPDPIVIRHADRGTPGLYTLIGVKFTTARRVAETAVTMVARDLIRTVSPCRTATSTLPFAALDDASAPLAAALGAGRVLLDEDIRRHLMDWYGPEAADVVHACAESGLVDRLAPGLPLVSGEIGYAVTHANAIHLSDAVLRRTSLGCTGHPGGEALSRAADIMGALMGWSDAEKADQIAEVEQRYEM